jgi:hypothetical protein
MYVYIYIYNNVTCIYRMTYIFIIFKYNILCVYMYCNFYLYYFDMSKACVAFSRSLMIGSLMIDRGMLPYGP